MTEKQLWTLPRALERAAERTGYGFTFVGDDLSEQEHTWESLLERAKSIAVALGEHGMKKGDHVALILPEAGDFIPTFLGVVQGGGVPVPLYPPMGVGQLGGYLDHCKHIVGASRSKLLVTNRQIKAVIGKVYESAPDLRAILMMGDLDGDASRWSDPGLTLDDTCFLQFTSGSTNKPKGVVVTHGNLAHNAWAVMREGLDSHDEDRGVSWLPLFHDMGLIGFVIAPIHHRVPVSFLSPMTFLKRPASWLEILSKHRGTITYGPNFSYALTAKRVRDRDLEGLDLSCVRVAGCGAEPIQADTLRGFADRFAKVGFEQQAFVPSYGMAEYTLAIAFSTGVPTDRVWQEKLWAEGVAEPAPEDADPTDVVEIVHCGPSFAEHGIRIVDLDDRAVLPDRRVGEIEVRGPSVMQGYYEMPEATRETIGGDGWMRTGDLGYLAEGNVYICGRAKDVIIVNGKNYYPQDLEWAASEVQGVRAGNVIAFPSHRPGLGREAVIVVAETKEPEGRDALARAVQAEIARETGLTVDEVVMVDAGTIPKTSSGKLQRRKARQLYEEDALKKREDESKLQTAARVAESQLAHLKLSIFGKK
ncbi:MAG TPA: fatty acyl-AMP ligase [Sandaracinaceae bacterium LLY-WYZ-13_1]|nr:fatty acyl-AMP ligase [Sandaracinaceae bacterium LLY-WYZ-13_1]